MSESANTLDILIQLRAKIDEALQAQNALNDVKAAAKAGAATDEDASKAAEKLNTTKREFLHLLHGLPPEFHSIGYSAIQSFYNPLFAAMTVLTGLFVYAKKQLDEYNKALDEQGAKAAQADFLPGIEAKLETLRNGAASMQEWLDKLVQEQTGEEGIAAALAGQLELMKQINAIKEQQAKAEEALAIAKIKQGQVSGRISEPDAERQMAEVRAKAIADEQKRKEKDRYDELGTKVVDRAGLEALQAILKPIAEAAKNAQTQDEAKRKQLEKDFGDETYGKKLADNTKAREAAEKSVADQQVKYNAEKGSIYAESSLAKLKAAQDNLDRLNEQFAQLQRGRSQFNALPDAATEQAMKDAREKAVTKADETAAAIGKLNTEISNLQKTISTLTGLERIPNRERQQATYTDAITGDDTRAKKDIETINKYAGRPADSLSSAERAQIIASFQDLHSVIADMSSLISDLAAAGGNIKDAKTDLADLKNRVKALELSK